MIWKMRGEPAPKPVTVADFIKMLQKHDPNLVVLYRCHSEQCVLESFELSVFEGCAPRADGWVHDARPDKPRFKYLLLPGN